MERYLEILSVAKTVQICHLPHAVPRGKAAFQVRIAVHQQTPIQRDVCASKGLILSS